MIINTNVSALNTLRNLNQNEMAVANSTAKLSSGFRINKASDDAGGLAIANQLRNTGAALGQASRNAQQASSMLQIADGATQSIGTILDRMKELATQAGSDNVGTQRTQIDAEYQALNSEITRIVATTSYQGVNLLSGTGSGSVAVSGGTYTTGAKQIASVSLGAGASASATYTLTSASGTNGLITMTRLSDGAAQTILASNGAQSLNFSSLGVNVTTSAGFAASTGGAAASADGATVLTGAASTSLDFLVDATGAPATNDKISVNLGTVAAVGGDLTSKANAIAAMGSIDTAVSSLNTFVGNLGAAESRLNTATTNLASKIQNTAAAESTIRDVDMASEMATFSKSQILAQASEAMLAQANNSTQSVLQLIRGQ